MRRISKLTDELFVLIKTELKKGFSVKDVAQAFQVSTRTVNRINRAANYNHYRAISLMEHGKNEDGKPLMPIRKSWWRRLFNV